MSAARKSLKKPYVAAAESSAPVAVTQDSGVADSGAEAKQMEKIEEKSSKAKHQIQQGTVMKTYEDLIISVL